jgi:hypothetical protein
MARAAQRAHLRVLATSIRRRSLSGRWGTNFRLWGPTLRLRPVGPAPPWNEGPRNVRELRNAIARASLVREAGIVGPEDLAGIFSNGPGVGSPGRLDRAAPVGPSCFLVG